MSNINDRRFVILLRGINVGGHNKIKMADLRSALTKAGFGDVATYIQSGNIIADGGGRSELQVVSEVRDVITQEFDLSIPVVARPAGEWQSILAANPFEDEETNPKLVHVSICDTEPSADAISEFDTAVFEPDQFTVVGRNFYLRYPNGSARSKLTGATLERKLGVTTTARNWSTMLKIADLID